MSGIELFLSGWVIMAVMMSILWLVANACNKGGVVDIGWTAGIGILAVYYAIFASEGYWLRSLFVAGLVIAWSLRLAGYLLIRLLQDKEEDGRYKTLKEKWGDQAKRKLFFFFQIQGLTDSILSIPILIIILNPKPYLTIWEIIGGLVIILSIIGEYIADKQLKRFKEKRENKGKSCRSGLWRYSRHPNYFFEWLHWIGYVFMGIVIPYGWLTLISPILMLYFLLNVTGVPLAEEQALHSRGKDYRRYQKETYAFFPWFPKK